MRHKKNSFDCSCVRAVLACAAVCACDKEMKSDSNQEYLDRQDGYSLVFFLDEGDRWLDTYIYINSWRVILQSGSL